MQSNGKNSTMTIALPSKGALEKSTNELLAACGLRVSRPNDRQYVGSIPSVPNLTVLFQRAPDIFTKVEEGIVDLGITGYDVVCEHREEYDDVVVVYDKLGYGKCSLVLAVPESWVDVATIEDLADLALLFKEKGRTLRIATKYANLTKNWLYEKRVVNFSLVEVQGAMEAAPNMGYADMIADITSTGTTLRENRLKQIAGGTILESQACLIGNRRRLLEDESKLEVTKLILELLEAHQEAKKFISITANVRGKSQQEICDRLTSESELSGIAGRRGPTIAKVYSSEADDWYAATIVVRQGMLMPAINHLRKVGGTDITVFSPHYVFDEKSRLYQAFLDELNRERS